MTPVPPCLQAALDYLAQGWSVIPLCPPDHLGVSGQHETNCKSPGKAPLWPWKDYQDRLPRSQELKLLWTKNKDSNVGIVLGPVSGLLALDIDEPAGEHLLAKFSKGQTPNTLEFSTGYGRRLLFAWPEGLAVAIKSYPLGGHEALRILSKGSQTAAPPSRHWTGKVYEWTPGKAPGQIPPAQCPEWLLKLLMHPEGDDQGAQGSPDLPPACPESPKISPPASADPVNRAKAYLAKCEPAIAGQGGHNHTYKIAVKLTKGFGLSPENALKLLLQDFNPRCQPPWTEKELQHKVSDAYLKGECESFLTNGHAPTGLVKPPGKPKASSRRYSDIPQKYVEWLWNNWLPLGKLAMLDGDPGLGKSTMLLDLAARVSRNGLMPDGSLGMTGNVVVLSAEDGPEDTIKPRLQAAGAVLERIHDLSHIVENGEERPLEIPKDLKTVRDKLKETDARLLIIDPLMAFLEGVDANKDQSIRRALYKLSKIAEECRCAVIAMRHLNKGSGTKALYRGNSSIGVIGHARAGLLVAADPDDENRRIVAVVKCNLAAKPGSLAFSLEPLGEVCRIGWMGQSHHKADDLVAQAPTDEEKEMKQFAKGKIDQALAILHQLAQDHQGKVPIKQARAECHSAGLSSSSIDRAIKKLGWTVHYQTDPSGKRSYFWMVESSPSTNDEVVT